MARYFKVIKENFLWHKGAIVTNSANDYGYLPIDKTNIWDYTNCNGGEYISAGIIENCPDYFIEVYPINLLTKTVYKVKEEARAMLAKDYE